MSGSQHEFELWLRVENAFSRLVRVTDDHLFMEQGTVATNRAGSRAEGLDDEALDPANGPMFTAGGGDA
jgi:hypothetical protein